MEFNRYIWELYTASDCGRAALARPVESFAGEGASLDSFALRLPVFRPGPDGELSALDDVFVDFDVRQDLQTLFSEEIVEDTSAAKALFYRLVNEGLALSPDESGEERTYFFAGEDFEEDVFSNIERVSLALYHLFPEYFVPFFFRTRFDRFEAICHSFNIPIPVPPGKTQKRDRAVYYLELNDTLQEFRTRHRLAPPELIAFLYEFAPRVIASERDSELPPPARVWFTMGGINDNGDFEFLDHADENTTARWQGSLDTRRGDVILMWCVAPCSYLHSVWRALDDGFADLFFYFYSSMRIGQCVKLPPVYFREFMNHPVLGSNKSVRAHFQGAGGKPFPLEDYLVLLEVLRAKGFDSSFLPVPPPHAFALGECLSNERDVEIQLVEPLLAHLGYCADDWLRQMPLRMGRGERNYPDYAIEPKLERGEESARFLVETKYEIATRRQLEDAFIQGKSYALRLQALAFLLAAKEGLWLYRRDDGFSAERQLHWSWQDIEHPDRFHELAAMLGKGCQHRRSGRHASRARLQRSQTPE